MDTIGARSYWTHHHADNESFDEISGWREGSICGGSYVTGDTRPGILNWEFVIVNTTVGAPAD